MKCQFFQTKPDGQVLVGAVYLRNGKITSEAADASHQIAMDDVMQESHPGKGARITREANPEGWFKSLPSMYNGSYFRAKMVKDEADTAVKFAGVLHSK